jgi:hypothetical protein
MDSAVKPRSAQPASPEPQRQGAPVRPPAPRGPWSVLTRRVTRSVSTTPGQLSLIAVGLVVASLLFGLFAALSVQSRADTIDDIVENREPQSAAAQELYRALSDADATAASAFLSGGVEPENMRARYETDIARAGAALAKASSDVSGLEKAGQQADVLNKQLPVYAGLVETARANNRQGFPAGAAYLREASALMRSEILPAAQELYRIDAERLSAEQDDASGVPWLALVLVLGLLGALIAAQVYLTRRTNRLLNVGLLAATGAVVVALLWGTVALLIESARVEEGRQNGSQQVDVLVQARIVALKCRANETMTLVARGDGPGYEQEFKQICGALSGTAGDDLLSRARGLAADEDVAHVAKEVDAAIGNATRWLATHGKIRELDDGGDYESAVGMAIGDTPDGAATAFYQLDTNLVDAITAGRTMFYEQTTKAGQTLIGLAPGLVVLALVAAVGATMGIRQRLQEYR